jgi:hypothetical protein
LATQESSWSDLAQELKAIKVPGGPLRAEWYTNEGCEDYGIWLLLPDGPETEEARASFSLIAACAIAKLGSAPIPVPEAVQHDPHWELSCKTMEEIARRDGKAFDLDDAVPYGLGDIDRDAVDSYTRAWLELLRIESPAFRGSTTGRSIVGGKEYTWSHGTIRDVCRASEAYCLRRQRDEIGRRLIGHSEGNELDVIAVNSEHLRRLSQELDGLVVQGAAEMASEVAAASEAALADLPIALAMDAVQKQLDELDWAAIGTALQASQADVFKIDEAIGRALPLTPRTPEEESEFLYRFSIDPKGLGLSVEQFNNLLTPAEWLEHFHRWEGSRQPRLPQSNRRAGEAEGRKSTEEVAAQPSKSVAPLACVAKLEKGDMSLLLDVSGTLKRAVTLDTAKRFGGVSRRAIEKAVKKGPLEAEGKRQNRRISVQSSPEIFSSGK